MKQLFVTDTRPAGDASLQVIPRIENFETLQTIFHLEVDRSRGWNETSFGQACWKVVGFEVGINPAEIKLKVLQKNSHPAPEVVVFRHWPSGPQLPGAVRPAYFNSGEGKFTNGLGEVTFGNVSEVGPTGGADTIWISASPPGQEPQFSNAVRNLGRHSATGLVPNPVFQYVVQDGSEMVQEQGDYTLAIVTGGQEMGQLAFSQAATGDNYIVLRQGATELGRIAWQKS